MCRQIHAVMQHTQNVYGLTQTRFEHHKVAPFSAQSRHMERANFRSNVATHFDPQQGRAVAQSLSSQHHGFNVFVCLARPKILCRPRSNIPRVHLNLIGQPKLPDLAHDTDGTLPATDAK